MKELHFSNLDLNLLRVFDALLDERSVTRAGARLGLSQSAVSHALGRLRHVLDDPLFIRRSGGVEPTPRALEIGPALHTALLQLQDALSPPGFNPATTERRFTLAAGPYACTILAPALVERLRAEAPRVELQIEAYGPDYQESLDLGRIDAAIVSLDEQPGRFHFVPLFIEAMAWVARPDHPLAKGPLTEARLASARRIVISRLRSSLEGHAGGVGVAISRRSAWGEPDRADEPSSRVVGVTVPDAFSAVIIASRSDMAALVPRRLAQMASDSGRVVMREPPRPSEPLQIGALFRADRLAQPALAWFANMLRDVAQAL
jgi:DNA-binding transcriptional LysR family regulator